MLVKGNMQSFQLLAPFDRSIGAFFTIALIFLIRSELAGVHALSYLHLRVVIGVTANRRLFFARVDFGWRRFESSLRNLAQPVEKLQRFLARGRIRTLSCFSQKLQRGCNFA